MGLDILLMGLVLVSPVSIVGPCKATFSSRFWMDELGRGVVVDDTVV